MTNDKCYERKKERNKGFLTTLLIAEMCKFKKERKKKKKKKERKQEIKKKERKKEWAIERKTNREES